MYFQNSDNTDREHLARSEQFTWLQINIPELENEYSEPVCKASRCWWARFTSGWFSQHPGMACEQKSDILKVFIWNQYIQVNTSQTQMCWIADHYHLCSNLGVGISERGFIFDFTSFGGHSVHLANHVYKISCKTSSQTHMLHWNHLYNIFPWTNLLSCFQSLFQSLLIYDPSKRIAAKDALKHHYFDDLEKDSLPASSINHWFVGSSFVWHISSHQEICTTDQDIIHLLWS